MPVILADISSSATLGLVTALVRILPDARCLTDLEEITQEAKAGDSVVIVLDEPARAMAATRAADADPTQALADWCRTTEALLAFCRQRRRHVTLVGRQTAEDYPLAVADALTQRHGLAIGPSPLLQAPALSEAADPVTLALATLAILSDPRATALAEELEALLLTLRTAPAGPAGAQIATTVQAARQAYRRLQDRSADSASRAARAEAATALLEAMGRETQVDGALMAQDLDEALELQDALRGDLAQAHRRADAAQERVNALLTSWSWKVAGPVRGVGRILRRLRLRHD